MIGMIVKIPAMQSVFLALCLCLLLLNPAWSDDRAEVPPLQAVPQLDLQRYLGTWYEIALYPNMFQRMCVTNTRAQYAALPDGQIEVRNSCKNAEGKTEEVIGRAKLAAANSVSQLKVRFAPEWLAWLPLVWANYWVIQLAPDYRYAVVSEPGRAYLWILARQPVLAPEDQTAILTQLVAQGFDTSRLRFTPQASQ
jgi:apolipoprotein D and lipocalin family protein